MDEQKRKPSMALSWLCMALSVILLALVIIKTSAGGDVNAGVLILAMGLLVAGIVGVARSRKVPPQ